LRIFLYSRVDPTDPGGVQSVFSGVAAHLRDRGHTVMKAWSLPNPAAPDEGVFGLPALVWRRGRPAPRSLLNACVSLARLAWVLARFRPHVVNLHFVTRESTYFLLLRRVFRFKLVLSVHGSDVLRPKPWDAPVLPRALRAADAITVVSALTAAQLCQRYPGVSHERITVIPNGVDEDFWAAIPGEPLPLRKPIVLSVGRLHPVKGHDVLVSAFRAVVDRVPDARLVIVGEGHLRGALADRVGELNLSDHVQLDGQRGAADVRGWMSRALVYVLPSRSEGLPLSLLEAMAAGVPVVASRVGGVPEVLSDNTGLMVPPEDACALAEAIAGILTAPADFIGMREAARRRVRAFDRSRSNAAYERLMLRLTGLPTGGLERAGG